MTENQQVGKADAAEVLDTQTSASSRPKQLNPQAPVRRADAEPERWPVLLEQPLFRADRRLLRRYRDPDLLPLLRPGSIYVFTSGDRCERRESAVGLRGDDPVLVEATSVSVVATRPRRIAVWAHIPTTEYATDLPILVTFHCVVTDPETVARSGLVDLHGDLECRVRHERALAELRHRLDVEDVAAARAAITDALDTAFRSIRFPFSGMQVDYEGTQVYLSSDLRRHHVQLRNARWLQREHQLKHDVERQRVKDVEQDLLSSAERSEATAVTREERTAGQTAARQFQERDTQIERLTAQVQDWLTGDGAKRAPVDRRQIVEALFTRLMTAPGMKPSDVLHPTGLVELSKRKNGNSPVDIAGHLPPDDLDG